MVDRTYYQARSYSFAEYWKYFIARFNGVHAFGYNSASSEAVCRWPWQILGAIRAEARARERGEFFLSGKQRAIQPTSVCQISRKLHRRRGSFRNRFLKILL